jgi:hypothetical protein|tara:strand:+ start:266 stop:544 length:279 start_codon:yes stop_codon:yes gene_type:complete
MSSRTSFIGDENDEYILINNDDKIMTIEMGEGFIKLYKMIIPIPPKLPPLSELIKNNIKIKTRFSDFSQYKRYLQNKRQRQRRKNNKKIIIT